LMRIADGSKRRGRQRLTVIPTGVGQYERRDFAGIVRPALTPVNAFPGDKSLLLHTPCCQPRPKSPFMRQRFGIRLSPHCPRKLLSAQRGNAPPEPESVAAWLLPSYKTGPIHRAGYKNSVPAGGDLC
jgi:hypothetical protein